ncbi:hypothetical protein SCUCBS95973_007594 [Sporothrix curviconia]|uniref:MYND-type domain-containing protein n=1 Tax=Sporothrix curviconia TaxID=1260050 RepID=A0ABP0CEX4_9PEZI
MDNSIYPERVLPSLYEVCAHCLIPSTEIKRLMLCSACRCVRYCCLDHQAQDWPRHKSACTKTKRELAKVAKEEERLRKIKTIDGVREALAHMQDLLQLDRMDGMGMCYFVPFAMLRLDQDQECYDFTKWWILKEAEEFSNPTDMSQPFADLQREDALEKTTFIPALQVPSLAHLSALLLLKLKLVVDIRNIAVTRKVITAQRLPAELRLMIEALAVRSPISASRLVGLGDKALADAERQLVADAVKIIDNMISWSSNVLSGTVFHWNDVTEDDFYSENPIENVLSDDVQLAATASGLAYMETYGVRELLQEARLCAARTVAIDPTAMKTDMASQNVTDEQLLFEVSYSRVHHFLPHAVEDHKYLGPYVDRPSERRLRKAQARLEAKESAQGGYDKRFTDRLLSKFSSNRVWKGPFADLYK